MAQKISCFKIKNFRALNTLIFEYLNISKIRVLIQITLCRNARIQIDLSKNNCFSSEEAKNYIPRTEKRKEVPVFEMLEFSVSLSSSMIPILSGKLKIIAYRGSSTIPPSSKLELLRQYEMTSIVTKSSIIDDLGVGDPLLVCLFSVQNITKKIKNLTKSTFTCSKSQRRAIEKDVKSIQS